MPHNPNPEDVADASRRLQAENSRRADLNAQARAGRVSPDPVERGKWLARDRYLAGH